MVQLIALTGCPTNTTPPDPEAEWKLALSQLPGGLLSVSGNSATDVYAVGADPDDDLGPLVVHYDGQRWTRLRSGACEDLWWITDRQVGDSFFLVGENGLVLRYRPATGEFERQTTPGTETLFGVWGVQPTNLFAVGGDIDELDTSGVIWQFDGSTWTAVDVTAINPAGIPVVYKVWGRSEDEIYAVGARGIILRYDGATWTQLESPTTRTLFTVHGSNDVVVGVGGAQSGVIIESTGGSFVDVTPPDTLQMNGAFVVPDGESITVGREGAVAFRRAGQWANENTGLNLDVILDYHAAWADSEGGIWAVGGNIVGEPRTDGVLAYFGTRDVATELVDDTTDGDNANCPPMLAAELGFTDDETLAYTRIEDGGVMPLFTGGQGGSHIFATLRATGFPTEADGTAQIRIRQRVTLESDGRVLNEFSQIVPFQPAPDGSVEVRSRFVFLDAFPRDIDGETILVDFTLTSAVDETVTAQILQTLLVDLGG